MQNLIVISGPSGSGKSTLIERLLREHPHLQFSVSHTTRAKRANETHGKNYYFVTPEQFQQLVRGERFAEWADVHGHLYGTSWEEIREKSGPGRILVLDVDVQGARAIRQRFAEALLVFVLPPSLSELRQRLLKRGQPSGGDLERRLQDAIDEIKQYEQYDYLVVNDDVEQAYQILRSIVVCFQNATVRRREAVEKLLRGKG